MKRTLGLLMALLAASGVFLVAFADTLTIDLDGATLEELIAARTAIEAKIMSSGEYKEVEVPAGTYIVGEQIPAGEYTVTTSDLIAVITIYGKDGKEAFDIAGAYSITSDASVGRLVLIEGQTVEIVGTTVFAPYAGLGF